MALTVKIYMMLSEDFNMVENTFEAHLVESMLFLSPYLYS